MTAKDLDDCGMLIAIVIISMVFIIAMALMIGAFAYVIYMTWLVICLIALTRVVMAYMDPRTAHWIFVIPLIIITIIAGHIAFNATIYFEPVPHAYGNDFCMKGISNPDGTTTYTRADLWLPNTFIYVPFTKIKLYGNKVTYYPDRTYSESNAAYQVLSSNGHLMNVDLHWHLDPYEDYPVDLEKLFYKRGPNWEENYAKSIVNKNLVQNFAAARTFQSLETPSWGDIGAQLVCKRGQIAGVDTDVSTTEPSDTTRNELTITFTPTEAGVIEIEAWAYWLANTANKNVIIDDMTITQAD